MEIRALDQTAYAGKSFTMRYTTTRYLDIRRSGEGFVFETKPFAAPVEMCFEDRFFNEWLDEPVAYGAFEADYLLGYVKGFLETWNNRYRISNICVFAEEARRCGIGSRLMEVILRAARDSGARMAVLETQSCNEKAIAFYRKHGFDLIGFDLFAYTDTDPQRHEIRIEMGKFL